MKAQRKTWAKHTRYFIELTEHNDTIQNCPSKINIPNYLQTCKRHNGADSYFMKSVRSRMDWTEKELSTNKNPEGWLCAQRRPLVGLGNVGTKYRKEIERKDADLDDINRKVLPDYLFLVDDDTYININLFQSYIQDINPSVPMVYSGCLLERTRHTQKNKAKTWYVPYGGYGLIFSRGSLERLFHPLHCNPQDNIKPTLLEDNDMTLQQFETLACHRILHDNLLDEKKLYRQGMSISDIALELSKRNSYCMHSDWMTMYIINYYYLSNLVPQESFNRIHPYKDNYECRYKSVELCDESSHICHYQTPDSMLNLMRMKT